MAIATREANLFELSCDTVRVTYSTSSFAGPPLFSYSGPEGELSFSGDEIATLATALGMEVTVTLDAAPDLHTITFTLLLPPIKMPAGGDVEFDTLGITSTLPTTIAGPPEGAGQTYEAIQLHGTAQAVDF